LPRESQVEQDVLLLRLPDRFSFRHAAILRGTIAAPFANPNKATIARVCIRRYSAYWTNARASGPR
jgi:hypothetical protein